MTHSNRTGPELDEAVEWHVRLVSKDAREDDWLAFEKWLTEAPGNREAYDRVEATWTELELGDFSGLARAAPSPVIDLAGHRARPVPAPTWNRRAIAACIGLIAVGLAATYFARPKGTVYSTAKGESRTLNLADGSTIRLNSGSKIRVLLQGNKRRVFMDDAEASFDVAKDSNRPFEVTAGDRVVRVVGTEFNVLHHAGRLTVTLRRGTIDVLSAGSTVSAVRLAPGQELVHKDGDASSNVYAVDPNFAFAWQSGRLMYRETSLQDVVDDLNRYFTVPIRVDSDAGSLKFSGVLVIDAEDAVVQRIEAFLPVTAERSNSLITLHRKASESH